MLSQLKEEEFQSVPQTTVFCIYSVFLSFLFLLILKRTGLLLFRTIKNAEFLMMHNIRKGK